MKFILVLLAATVLAFANGCARQAGHEHVVLNWLTSFDKAQAQAKAENKLLMMDFTGSDWCAPCIRFDREIFSTQAFKNYADSNLVLLMVDFPFYKDLSPEQKKANEALQEKFKVEGYGIVVLLDGAGKKLGSLTFQEGGPEKFIAELEKLRKS